MSRLPEIVFVPHTSRVVIKVMVSSRRLIGVFIDIPVCPGRLQLRIRDLTRPSIQTE